MTIIYIKEKTEAIKAYNEALPELKAFFLGNPKFKNDGKLHKKDQEKLDSIATKFFGNVKGYLYYYIESKAVMFKFCWSHLKDSDDKQIVEYYENLFFNIDNDFMIGDNEQIELLDEQQIKDIELHIKTIQKEINQLKSALYSAELEILHYM